MQISKKEKNMLSIFGIILAGFIYYQFIYSNIIDVYIENKKVEKQEIEDKYNKAIEMINSMDSQKSNLKMLNAKITDEALPLYPVISQEHIILEIDDLLKKHSLEGSLEFDEIKLDTVPVFKKSDKKTHMESSVQKIADEYNNKYGEGQKQVNNNSTGKNDSEQSTESIEDVQDSYSEQISERSENSEAVQKENKIVYMEGKIKFYGTYSNVVKFVKAVEEHDKKIALYGIGMDINDSQWVKGEIGFGVYSIPKVNDEISEYLRWTINNKYGKAEPFQLNQPAGTAMQIEGTKSDFTISVKSISSELPTIMMGRTNDNLRTTYVYADGNNEQNAEIVFNQEGDNYYFKYKTSNGSMPVQYSGIGSQFEPSGRNIVIDIASESRYKADDKSGLKLNITNNTDKLIMVNISNDDEESPRISIEGNDNISVNKE